MRALIDARFMAARDASEQAFRGRVAADPRLSAETGNPWAELEAVQPEMRRLHPAYYLLETRAGGGSQLFQWANQIVRAAQEREKPSDQRLPEYADARLRTAQIQVRGRAADLCRASTRSSSPGGCPRPARS